MQIQIPTVVNAKTLSITLPIPPGTITQGCLLDENGGPIKDYTGPMPSFLPMDNNGGLLLEIDIDTGAVLNWTLPEVAQIEALVAYPS